MPDVLPWLALGIPVLLIVIWVIATWNRLIALRNHIRESAADIDVELKRRYDLIPNLVATVRGYATHERELFEQVTALRTTGRLSREEDAAERCLRQDVDRLLALSEQYPALKADAHFLALQQELVVTEDRLAAARRFFNANVRDYRNTCEQVPSSIIASLGSFPPVDWLVATPSERRAPRVKV